LRRIFAGRLRGFKDEARQWYCRFACYNLELLNAMNPRQDKARAKVCENCPVCRRARRKQRGLSYAFVKKVEVVVCPFGRSYARVYNRKPHEPVPPG
jgi:hypothetical protein